MIWKGHWLQRRLYQNARTWGGRRLVVTSLGKTVLARKMGLPTRAVGLAQEPFFTMVALSLPFLSLEENYLFFTSVCN